MRRNMLLEHSRLITYLERESRFDASLVDYFRLLPARLGSSAALRDAVACFCRGWSDSENASPSKSSVDPQAYGKALRSLQRALGDEKEKLATETLAAVSVIYRVEVLFGGQPNLQSVTHAQGIYSLMETRGPPNLDDDLDVCLAFEHQISVTNYLLYQGGDNLYIQPHWKDTLVQVSYDNTEISPVLIDHYVFSLQIGGWPEIIRQVKYLTKEDIDPTERVFSALLLWEHFENHKEILDNLRDGVMAEAGLNGQMADRSEQRWPTDLELTPADHAAMPRLLMYTLSLILNRLMRPVAEIICVPVSQIDIEYCRLSELGHPTAPGALLLHLTRPKPLIA
ncbi:hypothetical protein S7711_07754 [Stachybotrys chartarum IBT 7711]|uniref:Uncharacterized protein n=1 Tax=Stachybotrys chartarum (strain CBS 109288 / IBT 7711) TaxID=1280523 RepID=A0A084B8N1_STACB|nr:hypothetical protein S7711_07754 [Stachybotrys chartarum IBT 7711]